MEKSMMLIMEYGAVIAEWILSGCLLHLKKTNKQTNKKQKTKTKTKKKKKKKTSFGKNQ